MAQAVGLANASTSSCDRSVLADALTGLPAAYTAAVSALLDRASVRSCERRHLADQVLL
jgi:hypothetical protein